MEAHDIIDNRSEKQELQVRGMKLAVTNAKQRPGFPLRTSRF